MFSQVLPSVSKIILVVGIFLSLQSCTPDAPRTKCELIKVIDGDSMILNKVLKNGNKKKIEVRLLGVDAPEYTQDSWGPRAREFVVAQLSGATALEIEHGKDKKDKYGRSLVYLYYLVSDKQLESEKKYLLNEELLRNGFAEVYLDKDNNEYLRLFKEAEAQARLKQLNIWQATNGLTMSPQKYRKLSKKRKQKTSATATPRIK